ncbi:MAG: anaerobic ribonucleoside-triphosphate reductase activating protein [Rubrivivax sp.]
METLCIGGVTPFSTSDWPGRLAAVVFVQGCPWRCHYCHNETLQQRSEAKLDGAALLEWLSRRRGLLDGVVFSGGEPLLDRGLPRALEQVRELGFATGLHTAGIYPARLKGVLPLLDWVGLDLKASLDAQGSYGRITGSNGAHRPVLQCLDLILDAHRDSGLGYECRTTYHPEWIDEPQLLRTSVQLAARGVKHWVLQEARATKRWQPALHLQSGPEDKSWLMGLLKLHVPSLVWRSAGG